MKIYTDLRKWCNDIMSLAQQRTPAIAVICPQQLEVVHGFANDVNFEYCKQHDIPVYDEHLDGGSIVCVPGNLLLGMLYDNNQTKEFAMLHLAKDFVEWLKSKKLNVAYDNNDILVDGFKTCSSAGYNVPPDFKWTYEGMQFSINQNLDAISNICMKPMAKMPKGLSEYGITTNEVLAWTTRWISNYFNIELNI